MGVAPLLTSRRYDLLQAEMGYVRKVLEGALLQTSARDSRLYREELVVVDQRVRASVQLQHLPVVRVRRKREAEPCVEQVMLLDHYVQLPPAPKQLFVVRTQRVVVDAVAVVDRDRRPFEQLHRAPLAQVRVAHVVEWPCALAQERPKCRASLVVPEFAGVAPARAL